MWGGTFIAGRLPADNAAPASAAFLRFFIACTPLVITFFAATFLGEQLALLQLFGVLLSLAGAVLVISNGHPTLISAGKFGLGETITGIVLAGGVLILSGVSLTNYTSRR